MTKADLIAAVAEKAGLTKTSAEKAVAGFVAAVGACLKKGDKLTIVGFGTYRYKYASGREGEWFRTGFSPDSSAKRCTRASGSGCAT